MHKDEPFNVISHLDFAHYFIVIRCEVCCAKNILVLCHVFFSFKMYWYLLGIVLISPIFAFR